MTQKEKVILRLKEVGYVDNFWAINSYILRLGAIIYELSKEGWQFQERRFGEGKDRKNFFYYLKTAEVKWQPPQRAIEPTVTKIKSTNYPYKEYTIVDWGTSITCDCPASQFKRTCKHVRERAEQINMAMNQPLF